MWMRARWTRLGALLVLLVMSGGAFAVDLELCYCDPVLLVDDAVDSAWTLTLVSILLRQAGVDAVVPFALASTAAK